MVKELELEVVTPSKTAFVGKVESVTIPGTSGSFQILYNHAPLFSSFEVGTIKIVEPGSKVSVYSTGGGTVEVLNNKVSIIAESFESPEEIDIKRAREALQRAKERLAAVRGRQDIDIPRAEIALMRSINRLKLTGNYSGKEN